MPSTQKLLIGVGVLSTLCVPDAASAPVQSVVHDQVQALRLAHKQRIHRRRPAVDRGVAQKLRAIARCESGGNPRAVGAGGRYRGAYQFDRGTWASLGGRRDPAAAPLREQTRRAARLYARSGPAAWGACGAG